MKSEDIIVIGLKRRVRAFHRTTGERLWDTDLGGMLGDSFVSVVADARCVFAHCRGELFCLDLNTGQILWRDSLAGLGYGIASLALPGGPATPVSLVQRQQQRNSTDEASASGTAAAG